MITHERQHRKEPCGTCGGTGEVFEQLPIQHPQEYQPCPDCENLCSHGTEVDHESCPECLAEAADAALDDLKCPV